MRILRSLALIGACVSIAACGALPASGPGLEALTQPTDQTSAVELVDLTPEIAATLGPSAIVRPAPPPPARGVGGLFGLRAGDQVTVLVQEATTSVNAGGAVGPTPLPLQVVDAAGRIMVPFAGVVKVAGLSPIAAAQRIQTQLAGQLVEPQVVVSVPAPVGRSVSVLGDATAGGGLFPIRTGRETLLDAIAGVGGFAAPLHATRVRLTRRGESRVMRADQLTADPALNVRLSPRDVIAIERAPQSFIALGAVGAPGRLEFPSARLSLAEALALSRGLIDLRAAPQGVAILRRRPGQVPLLYRLDLSIRDGLVAAQLADVRDGDMIYAANAPITDLEKVLRILGITTGVLNSGTSLTGG